MLWQPISVTASPWAGITRIALAAQLLIFVTSISKQLSILNFAEKQMHIGSQNFKDIRRD